MGKACVKQPPDGVAFSKNGKLRAAAVYHDDCIATVATCFARKHFVSSAFLRTMIIEHVS